jgi:ankyrin repeat protein
LDKKAPTTPLHEAICSEQEDIARLTLERGTGLEAQDTSGSMALHVAAMHSNAKMVKLLLDCGARVDCPRRDRVTALMIATGRPEKDVVELLAERGADLYARDSHGWMPL